MPAIKYSLLFLAACSLISAACSAIVASGDVQISTHRDLLLAQRTFNLTSGTYPFADIDVFYQMYDNPHPSAGVVLLLHGAQYTSDNWVKLGTLKLLRERGARAIAVDMPGYGKTRHLPYVDNNMRAEFVKSALEFAARGHNVSMVLVSPSLSGKLSIPFLDRYGTMLDGWVALAPLGVQHWEGPWEFTHKQVQVLALYGDKDPLLPDADVLLKFFMKTQKVVFDKAGHACYFEQPQHFHDSMLPFVVRALGTPRPELDPDYK